MHRTYTYELQENQAVNKNLKMILKIYEKYTKSLNFMIILAVENFDFNPKCRQVRVFLEINEAQHRIALKFFRH